MGAVALGGGFLLGHEGLGGATAHAAGAPIKVGFVNALSGVLSITESSIRTALSSPCSRSTQRAASTGGRSSRSSRTTPRTSRSPSRRRPSCCRSDKVSIVIGGYTSASRVAMIPTFQKQKGLSLLRDVLRGPRVRHEHVLRRCRAEPVPARLRAVDHEEPRQDVLHRRVGLHLPAHGQRDLPEADQGRGRQDPLRQLLPARDDGLRLDDRGHRLEEARCRDLQPRRRLDAGLLQAVQGGRATRRTTCRSPRPSRPRSRSRRWARSTRRATT